MRRSSFNTRLLTAIYLLAVHRGLGATKCRAAVLDVARPPANRKKPFACELCDCKAARKAGLYRHAFNHVTAERPFNCDRYGYTATTLEQSRLHLAAVSNMKGVGGCVSLAKLT